MKTKRNLISHRAEWEAPVSETFAAASEKIAGGVDPFTTVFEAPFEPITTLTLSPRKGAPIRVHNTHGRIDEEAFAAIEEDLKTLGIHPAISSPDSS